MKESYESKQRMFRFPNIEKEYGEFDRVAGEFGIDTTALQFLAHQGTLVELDDSTWKDLENTDSKKISLGEWDKVAELAEQQEPKRDWADLQRKINRGTSLDAPIIMKKGKTLHLVAGNTRLMVAKASGIRPTILLFHVEPD